MKIARIIEYFPPHIGGMEGHGLILSLEQTRMGHKVEVFVGYGGNWKTNFRGTPSDFSIYIAPLQFLLPLYSKIRRIWFNIWAYNKVKKNHRKNPYDIIHLHGDFLEAWFGGHLAKKLSIPAVLTIHAGLNKRLLKSKNTNYFQSISKIICVSEEIANDLRSIDVSESKIEVISSGISLIEFRNIDENEVTALQNQYSKPIIISVGVFRVNKGFKYLVEAFKLVKKKINSASLIIIGSGLRMIIDNLNRKDEEREKLEAQAKGTAGIYFLGRQNHSRIIEYLKAADLFVLASISTIGDREGTPNSIMDAMAAGLPIVATKVGGTSYLVKENENGLLVEEKNSGALADAIIKLIGDENLKQKMRQKNLEDIKQKDWPKIVKKIDDIYKSIL